MSSFSPARSRSPLGCRIVRGLTGRAASIGLLLAFTALPACGDDDGPAEPTGVGGAADVPDASVRDLPGDGLEPTPDFDIDSRQRNPIGPEQVTEGIDELQNGPRGDSTPTPDAGPVAPVSDAGAANGTN